MERKDLNESIGKRVREIREYQGLSREKVAEKANISTQFLSDIEVGRKSMTTLTLRNICATLGVSSDYLLFGKQNSASSEPLWQLINGLDEKELAIAEDMIKILIQGFSLNKN